MSILLGWCRKRAVAWKTRASGVTLRMSPTEMRFRNLLVSMTARVRSLGTVIAMPKRPNGPRSCFGVHTSRHCARRNFPKARGSQSVPADDLRTTEAQT